MQTCEIMYRKISLFEETVKILFFNNENYKVLIPVSLMAKTLPLANCVFVTGA